MEHLIGVEEVHLGELTPLQKVVNCGAEGARSTGQIEVRPGSPGLPEMSAFDRVRIELKQLFDLVCRHRGIVNDPLESIL